MEQIKRNQQSHEDEFMNKVLKKTLAMEGGQHLDHLGSNKSKVQKKLIAKLLKKNNLLPEIKDKNSAPKI